jgi:GST-like protein
VLAEYPRLKAWFEQIADRPAVQRGVKVLAEYRKPIRDEKEREILFGKTQYERR